MRALFWIVATGVSIALPIGAVWYGRRRHTLPADVSPRWLNEHVYEKAGDQS